MPGTRIGLDLSGRPIIPNDPIVVSIDGDAPGTELVRLVRDGIDAAVQGAYGSVRKIHWVSALAGERARREKGSTAPESTLQIVRAHRLALLGPVTPIRGQPSVADELARLLDLWLEVSWLRTPARPGDVPALDTVLFSDANEDLAARVESVNGAPPTAAALRALQDASPTAAASLPLADPARADAVRAAAGELPGGVPSHGITLRTAATQSADRFVPAVVDWSKRLRRRGLVAGELSPIPAGASVAWASWMRTRLAASPGVLPDGVEPDGRLPVSWAFEGGLSGAALGAMPPSAVLCPAADARRLVRAFSNRTGGARHVARARLDPTSASGLCTVAEPPGDAAVDFVSPLAWLHAGALLLDALGWVEAAALLLTHADALPASGRWPAALSRDLSIDGVEKLGGLAFGRAFLELAS